MKTCTRCLNSKELSEFRLRADKRYKPILKYHSNICKVCESEVSNIHYFNKKHDKEFIENWRNKSRNYYKNHLNEIKIKSKKKRETKKYKENRLRYEKENRKKITEVHRAAAKKWAAFQRDNLTDVYCRGLIMTQNGGSGKCGEITKEMIEQKRYSILIKRKLYEINQKTNTSRSYGRVNSVFQGVNRD